MILDGLNQEQQRLVRNVITHMVKDYPDVPDLEDTLLYPESLPHEWEPNSDPWLIALVHLAYVQGWYDHRQGVIEAMEEED